MTELILDKRNEVFEAVKAAGINPADFYWDDEGDDIYLRHRWSPAYFFFGGVPGSYITRFVAGDDVGGELPKFHWYAVMERVALWLLSLRRRIETPDLWGALRSQTELLASASDSALGNMPFTAVEREEIARQLNELRETTKAQYSLSDQQSSDLDAKVDYLVDAAHRLGRKDWLNAFIGVSLSYVLGAAFPPEAAQHVFMTLMTSVARFFGHEIPGLGSG
jgi:hypothetical protein